MSKHGLPALLDDAAFRRLREDRPTLSAAVQAARAGPQAFMDFLVLAGGKGSPSTLHAVQELADQLARAKGQGLMCFPEVAAPTKAAGETYLRMEVSEERMSEDAAGWLRLQFRASARHVDALVPVLFVGFINGTAALLPWWTTMALLPGAAIACGAMQMAAGMVPGSRLQRTRISVLMVAALLAAGVGVFLTRLAPALAAEHPVAVAVEGAMFALNAVVFWRTAFNDPGFVPKNSAPAAAHMQPGARVCPTCNCVRPMRSKHDPFVGRCVAKFDHYCPLVWNAVGECNQADFVLFCFTMFVGQLLFLHLGATFLAARGEGVLHVLRHHPARGWTAHPVVMLNMCLQTAALLFNCPLCVRAVYGIVAELTTNEMSNLGRYTYLHHPVTGQYDNPFDAGVLVNAARFFGSLRSGQPLTDWDALAAVARDGKAPPPPLLSMAACIRVSRRVAARCGWDRPRGGVGSSHGHSHGGMECGHNHGDALAAAPAHHGHSHGGRECTHDHGAAAPAQHGHSHGGRECTHDHGAGVQVRLRDRMVPLSSLPPEVQAQLLAQLQAQQAAVAMASETV